MFVGFVELDFPNEAVPFRSFAEFDLGMGLADLETERLDLLLRELDLFGLVRVLIPREQYAELESNENDAITTSAGGGEGRRGRRYKQERRNQKL